MPRPYWNDALPPAVGQDSEGLGPTGRDLRKNGMPGGGRWGAGLDGNRRGSVLGPRWHDWMSSWLVDGLCRYLHGWRHLRSWPEKSFSDSTPFAAPHRPCAHCLYNTGPDYGLLNMPAQLDAPAERAV